MGKLTFKFDFKTRHAGISALTTIAVLACIIIINILAGELTLKVDLTPKKLFSLSEETRALLDKLERDVQILALYESGEEPDNIMEALNEYDHFTQHVNVRVLDPDRNPAILAQYSREDAPLGRGSFIVASGDYYRAISTMDLYDLTYNQQGQPQILSQKVEQQFTSAIAYVSSGRTLMISEIIGHHETPLAELGYEPILEQANYALSQISLTRSDIPVDTALVTLVGPTVDLSRTESAELDEYLAAGGSLLVALEYTSQPMENLFQLLARWDIEVRHGLVFEARPSRLIAEFGDNPLVFAPYIADHEALATLVEAKMDPVFQATMGFQQTKTRQRQLEFFPLLTSSEDSHLRTSFSSEDAMSMEPIAGDISGPIDIAVAVRQRNMNTYQPEGAAIVALGSASTLKGLGYLGQIKANADLLINLITWLINDDSTVNVPAKSLFRVPLNINTPTALIYSSLTIILLPLLSLGSGLLLYFKRRNQ